MRGNTVVSSENEGYRRSIAESMEEHQTFMHTFFHRFAQKRIIFVDNWHRAVDTLWIIGGLLRPRGNPGTQARGHLLRNGIALLKRLASGFRSGDGGARPGVFS